MNSDIEADVKELIGLFDVPAFARRGQDLELALDRLDRRCRVARSGMLDMVRTRLRQWAHAATSPGAWAAIFEEPIEPLWTLSGAEAPRWASQNSPLKRQIAIAQDLLASVVRFNHRWSLYLKNLNVEPTNHLIEQYNRYYVLEKECIMGSARLAAQHFVPAARVTADTLIRDHPLLPVPLIKSRVADSPGRHSIPHARAGHHDSNS
jgi:hypothetical protein